MKKTKTAALLCFMLALFCVTGEETSWAKDKDDFGNIVHAIESRYHVHRNSRFLMAFVGVAVKCSSFSGVKGFKAAIFEHQGLFASDPDASVDQAIRAVGQSGWSLLVRSYSRRTGESSYIYAQPGDSEMKLLIVSVERDEAAIVQLKINPGQLIRFIQKHEQTT